MQSAIVLLVCLVGYSAASAIHGGWAGLVPLHDDGQWRPHLDGSWLGSGQLRWGPSVHGAWAGHSVAGLGLGHHLWKRSIWGVNPNSLPVPADTLHVALAKNAQLVQQHTEGTRNILGGGIPLALPADTHEVAIGKQAHAIAHARQTAITGHGHGIAVAPVAVSHAAVAPVGIHGLGLAGVHGVGLAGVHGVGLAGVHGVGLAGVHGLGLAGVHGLGVAGVHGLGVHGVHGVHGAHGLW